MARLAGHPAEPPIVNLSAHKTVKRDFAGRRNILELASFNDIILTDETSVQLETHQRFCCRKRGQKPRSYPVKVHVWAGISWNGAMKACIFEGIMDAELYCQILDEFLVPFIQTVYLLHHKFMQDNAPKHTSR